MFGFPPCESFVPRRWLHDVDEVQVGRETPALRHCPGHTPGHAIFHSASARRAFVLLIAGITHRLWPIRDDTVFIPGHGPESALGAERRHNPYVGGT